MYSRCTATVEERYRADAKADNNEVGVGGWECADGEGKIVDVLLRDGNAYRGTY